MAWSEEVRAGPLGGARRRAHPLSAWATVGALAACDSAVLGFAFSLAIAIWMRLRPDVPLEFYLGHWPVFAFFLAVYWLNGLYRTVGLPAVDELRKTVVATTTSFLILVTASFLVKESALYSRGIAALAWTVAVLLLPVLRFGVKQTLARREWFGSDAVVVGSREVVERIECTLRGHRELGLRPVARTILPGGTEEADRLLPEDLVNWVRPARAAGIATCIVAIPSLRGLRTGGVVTELTSMFRRVIVVPEMEGVPSLWISATDLYGLVGIEMKGQPSATGGAGGQAGTRSAGVPAAGAADCAGFGRCGAGREVQFRGAGAVLATAAGARRAEFPRAQVPHHGCATRTRCCAGTWTPTVAQPRSGD